LASGTSSSEEIWLVARTDCCQEYYFIEFILISLTIPSLRHAKRVSELKMLSG